MTDETKPDRRSFWFPWLVASTVGFGLGSGIGRALAAAAVGTVGSDPQGGSILGPGGPLLGCAVAVSVGGIMQWLVVRRRVSLAGLWVLPTAALFASYVVATGDMPALAGGAVFGLALGALTGIPLALLLRRSSQKIRRDVSDSVGEAP